MRASLRLSRRSFVSALLAFLSSLRPSQPRRPQARMTMVDGWARFFLWCGFTGPTSLPAAA